MLRFVFRFASIFCASSKISSRLDNNIDRDIYEKKNQELSEQLKKLQEEQQQLMELSENQENTRTRLREFRKVLGSGEILESFDRVVFESVVEKIIS